MDDNELWQGYYENGEPMRPVTKAECHGGMLHGSAHVWVWRQAQNGQELLLQRRSQHMRTWKGYLDISAAGHIDAGETPIQTAVRELEEELLIRADPEKLQLLFVYRMNPITTDSGIMENEFQWVYGYENSTEAPVLPNEKEVTDIMWTDKQHILSIMAGKQSVKIVPHELLYMNLLFEKISMLASDRQA